MSTCLHADKEKKFFWKKESFSEMLSTEYEYYYCSVCNDNYYTGQLHFVPILTKDQKMNNQESVSRALKSRHAKEGKGLSLKQFARQLVKSGDAMAETWFANKEGLYDLQRSEKNIARISAEISATKVAHRSKKKKDSGPVVVTATKK